MQASSTANHIEGDRTRIGTTRLLASPLKCFRLSGGYHWLSSPFLPSAPSLSPACLPSRCPRLAPCPNSSLKPLAKHVAKHVSKHVEPIGHLAGNGAGSSMHWVSSGLRVASALVGLETWRCCPRWTLAGSMTVRSWKDGRPPGRSMTHVTTRQSVSWRWKEGCHRRKAWESLCLEAAYAVSVPAIACA